MSCEGVFSLEASEGGSERVVINVGGVRHETLRSTLMNIPGSRLTRLLEAEKPPEELFFDRNPDVFTHVLQFYRTGRLHCPTSLCGLLLEDEFAFWGISGSDVEPCCWAAFHQNRDAMEALDQIEASVTEEMGQKGWQQKIWALFDKPYSSISAMVIAVVSLLFIFLSITAFSLQTDHHINSYQIWAINSSMDYSDSLPVSARVLDSVELVCTLWFVFEFVMRLLSCPSKPRFFMNVLNVVDLLALFPWFFRWCSGIFCGKAVGFLHIMRCVRVLRVFKLMQHVSGVRVLNYTLRSSASTLFVIPLTLFCFTLIFGTMFYYSEFDHVDAYISNIPSGFWWAVVTLTTVGYGDVVPVSVQGKCVGVLCAAVGVLLIVLPVPVIVHNFIKFNSLVKTKSSMPRKKE